MTPFHTTDHEYRNLEDNALENIRWLCKIGQRKNRDMPTDLKSAFIIVNGDIELTTKGWTDVYKKPNGKQYSESSIQRFAREQKYGFRYKVFSNLRGEVWKAIPGCKNKKGEWFVSNKNRMKYKTTHAENILSVDQLIKKDGYPTIRINGKQTKCHQLSMMTFRPREYSAKLPGDIILHKNDDRLDFNPFRLRWGTPPENGKDAHRNGKFVGTKTEQRPVASYIIGVLEQVHESLNDAAKYLRGHGYPDANHRCVGRAAENDTERYDRTWRFM
jgi:hypothetical protein